MSDQTPIDVVQVRMRLHNAFKAKGLSIRAAERDCGVAVSTFQKFIAGETNIIGADILARAAAVTGVSADALLFGEGRSPAATLSSSATASSATAAPGTRHIAHNLIQPSALNPRKRGFDPASLRSLADSILAHGGLMQNLVVRPVEESASESGPFEIVAGERRWRAYALLIAEGKADEGVALPCAVRALDDDAAMELMLVENMERQDLSPMEEGRAFLELWNRRSRAFGKRKAGDVVKYLAERLNRSTRFIQKRIRLARDLVPEAQDALEQGKISLEHAQVLATAPKDAQRAQTGLLVALPPDAQPTPRAMGQSIASALPDLALAVFDRKNYDAEVFEFDGKDYAVDVALFARMQDRAIKDRRAAYIKRLGDQEFAFVEEGPAFKASDYVLFDANDIDQGEPPALGVFIEVQDKGAWLEARFIENLDRKTGPAMATPKRAAKGGDDDGDGESDAVTSSEDARPRPALPALDAEAERAAASRQFAALRATLQNRIELCLGLALFSSLCFNTVDLPDDENMRLGNLFLPAARDALLERCLKTLDLRWDKNGATEADENLFAETLLDKLLTAPLAQLERLVAHVLAEHSIPQRPLKLNALERRVFQAAGLDPDAATTKEAA